MSSDPHLSLTFGSDRCIPPRARSAVYLAHDVDVVGNAIDPRKAVEDDIILRETIERCGHQPDADVAHQIHSRRAANDASELFLHNDLAEDIDLIRPDTFSLIRIRHLEAEL